MIDVKELPASRRKDDFFKSLNLSLRTTQNYRTAIQSTFIQGVLKEECNTVDLFDLVDIKVLGDLYGKLNHHPKNIKNHRGYSAAIMKYIRYLNQGVKYGKRIDFGKSR